MQTITSIENSQKQPKKDYDVLKFRAILRRVNKKDKTING